MRRHIFPDDPLQFVRTCMESGHVYWTYHVNMRLRQRGIRREEIVGAAPTFEIIEENLDDKYYPSYLLLGFSRAAAIHVLVAADVPGNNVRIVTAYYPNNLEWSSDFRKRVSP